MPLTAKGNKILAEMVKEYGEEKGKEVFYASKNAGKISGVDTMDAGAGVLVVHDGSALFLKRSPEANDHQGEWCCPGGSVENGETPEQAARREIAEETGFSPGDMTQIDEGSGFFTFRANVDGKFMAKLNREHTDAVWAPLAWPPQPLHPGVAATLRKLLSEAAAAGSVEAAAQEQAKALVASADAGDLEGFDQNAQKLRDKAKMNAQARSAGDKREYDTNGWFEVFDNPLSKVGVYPYSEASLTKGGDRNKMINVYRPAEELGSEETVRSFRLMPWIDDHPSTLLGSPEKGLVPAEKKGVEGVIGEKTYFRDGVLYGNIKVFSEALAKAIASGKRELSLGYHCDFVKQDGVFEGTPYQYVQRNMRGNHGASVKFGRMGSEVRVLDAAEALSLSFALDLKEPAGATATDSTTKEPHMAAKDAEVKDPEGKKEDPNKKSDLKNETADAMNAEEESNDAAEAAKDAAEEKEDGDKEDKEAKDRRRARDRRAGARDARKAARDKRAKDAKDAKAAADAAAAKSAKDAADAQAARDAAAAAAAKAASGKGLDASEVAAIVKQEVATATTALVPTIRKEEAAKHKLYGRLSPIVGAFDHAEMSHVEMATYGLKKLGVTVEAADPVSALDMFLLGRGQAAEAAQGARQRAAQDGTGAGDTFLDKYLRAA